MYVLTDVVDRLRGFGDCRRRGGPGRVIGVIRWGFGVLVEVKLGILRT